jgi:hypothetical protein
MPAVRKIVQDARSNGYRFSAIVNGIVRSTPFQMREAQARQGEAVNREAQAR